MRSLAVCVFIIVLVVPQAIRADPPADEARDRYMRAWDDYLDGLDDYIDAADELADVLRTLNIALSRGSEPIRCEDDHMVSGWSRGRGRVLGWKSKEGEIGWLSYAEEGCPSSAKHPEPEPKEPIRYGVRLPCVVLFDDGAHAITELYGERRLVRSEEACNED